MGVFFWNTVYIVYCTRPKLNVREKEFTRRNYHHCLLNHRWEDVAASAKIVTSVAACFCQRSLFLPTCSHSLWSDVSVLSTKIFVIYSWSVRSVVSRWNWDPGVAVGDTTSRSTRVSVHSQQHGGRTAIRLWSEGRAVCGAATAVCHHSPGIVCLLLRLSVWHYWLLNMSEKTVFLTPVACHLLVWSSASVCQHYGGNVDLR